MLIEQIKNIKETVQDLLEKQPKLRDDDYKLISTIWWMQTQRFVEQLSAMELLTIHSKGQLVCSESIRRCRALLQKQNPELRGKMYKQRKDDGRNFSKEINDI